MNAVLISTNLGSFNVKALKEIASKALKLDLSSKLKDRLEAIRVLSRIVNDDVDEISSLKHAHPILGHISYTFVIGTDWSVGEVIDHFHGFKITYLGECVWIITGSLDQWLNVRIDKIQTILENEGLSFLFQ